MQAEQYIENQDLWHFCDIGDDQGGGPSEDGSQKPQQGFFFFFDFIS